MREQNRCCNILITEIKTYKFVRPAFEGPSRTFSPKFFLALVQFQLPAVSTLASRGEQWLQSYVIYINYSGALARAARSGAPWVKKCGKLPIRENLVITWPSTDRPPARPSVRTTGIPMTNNSINRYGNPNATERNRTAARTFRKKKQQQGRVFLRLYFWCLHSRV